MTDADSQKRCEANPSPNPVSSVPTCSSPLVLVYSSFAWANIGPIAFQPTGRCITSLFPCRRGGRNLWPRSRLARLRWDSGAALDGMARRGLCRFLHWAAPTSVTMAEEQRSLDREIRGRHRLCCRQRGGLRCALAICLRFAHWRPWGFDSLSANAYRMYLIHLPSGCNMRCWASACLRSARLRSYSAGP